eukprot:TRINITY_DN21206_c0_g1_i1.p1 TRINITY_DN21206_c0_g1~~TRINITY_DN21206_c0_g1_i1.p1  ORF type:complete len:240 (+),score=31.63 TRINITY_DN21206_c0_g1_i1:64-783(+)
MSKAATDGCLPLVIEEGGRHLKGGTRSKTEASLPPLNEEDEAEETKPIRPMFLLEYELMAQERSQADLGEQGEVDPVLVPRAHSDEVRSASERSTVVEAVMAQPRCYSDPQKKSRSCITVNGKVIATEVSRTGTDETFVTMPRSVSGGSSLESAPGTFPSQKQMNQVQLKEQARCAQQIEEFMKTYSDSPETFKRGIKLLRKAEPPKVVSPGYCEVISAPSQGAKRAPSPSPSEGYLSQ